MPGPFLTFPEVQLSMRILHIISSFSPNDGGPPEAVRQLVRAYVSLGTDVEVLCLDHPDERYLADLPCRVHALGQSFLGRYAFSPRLFLWLQKNAHRFDAMIMNGIWSFPGVAVYVASRRAKSRYGVFAHGALDPWFNRTYPLKHLKKLLYWPLQHAILHNAAAVFFTTATERDLALSSFRPSRWNSVVVPYGIVDPEDGGKDGSQQIDEFRRGLPGLGGRRYLLFLGRIHEKKGCDLLIEAFSRVASDVTDLDLVVAGPDQMGIQGHLHRLSLERGLGGRVHWPGLISGDVKWGALRACEAFVLPSHQENFGISVVEALAVGRPVLISDQVNIAPDIGADGVGLVENDTLEGTTRLLRRWLDLSTAEREAMADRARSCFLGRYEMQQCARVINNLFSNSMDGRRY